MQNIFEKKLHLIAFDIPVPVNYGGAIDIFHKITSLKRQGVKVILHCFQYGREEAEELLNHCEEVYYYPRQLSPFNFLSQLPYIVNTRKSEDLLKNLLKDPYPILFEGLHSCYLLDNKLLTDRTKIVRTHNIEHEYYKCLGKIEKNYFRKRYFFTEASRLENFEKKLTFAQGIAAISLNDKIHFSSKHSRVERISAFHPFYEVNVKPGLGEYVLYHGSLEVGENNEAAMFLVNHVFSKLDVKFIIAGNKASKALVDIVSLYPNIEIRSSITTEEIYQLVANAQINILPTFQATGIKLKLLAALFSGRHCIVNEPMVRDTGLEGLCHIAGTAESMIGSVIELMGKEFDEQEVTQRQNILLNEGFSNDENVKKLISLIYS
jgi:hypothetical protein